VLAKIAEMKEPNRTKAKRIDEIVKVTAPELTPRTWYGMPAYAKDDKVIFLFQDAEVRGEVRDIRLQRQDES
jgi:uncharacterized protein YdhG (YjbR/CyaY superfamily)